MNPKLIKVPFFYLFGYEEILIFVIVLCIMIAIYDEQMKKKERRENEKN